MRINNFMGVPRQLAGRAFRSKSSPLVPRGSGLSTAIPHAGKAIPKQLIIFNHQPSTPNHQPRSINHQAMVLISFTGIAASIFTAVSLLRVVRLPLSSPF